MAQQAHSLLASGSNDRKIKLSQRRTTSPILRPEVPRDHLNCTQVFWDAAVEAWHGRSPWPLLLAGSIGSGKTVAALAIADHTAWPMAIHTEKTLRLEIEAAKAKTHQNFHSEQAVWDAWSYVNLAILDDLGASHDTAASADLVAQAINFRDYKPLIITTNLTAKELEQKYGDRIWSRIECGTVVEAFDLPDRR